MAKEEWRCLLMFGFLTNDYFFRVLHHSYVSDKKKLAFNIAQLSLISMLSTCSRYTRYFPSKNAMPLVLIFLLLDLIITHILES